MQDYLTYVIFKTRFSGTTCPIVMKLTHSIEGGALSLYTRLEVDLAI